MPRKKVANSSQKTNSNLYVNVDSQLETPTEKLLAKVSMKKQKQRYIAETEEQFIQQQDEPMSYAKNQNGNINSNITQAEKMNDVVTKMFAKNKICIKNAFDVPVIDVNTLINIISKNGEGSWMKISSTLENSSKIYGYRVDFVIDGLSKMTNSISRAQKTQQVLNNNQGIQIKKKQEIITGTYSETINYNIFLETDRHRLQASEIQPRDNPILHETRRKFDQYGVNGMLLNILGISSLQLQLHPRHNQINCSKQQQQQIIPSSSDQLPSELTSFINQNKKGLKSCEIFNQIKFLRQFLLHSSLHNQNFLIDLEDEDHTAEQIDKFIENNYDINNSGKYEQNYHQNYQNSLENESLSKSKMSEHEHEDDLHDTIHSQNNNNIFHSTILKTQKLITKRKPKQYNKKQGPKKERKKRIRNIIQQKQIEFDSCVANSRDEILTINPIDLIGGYHQSASSYLDKNLEGSSFPQSTAQFSITIKPYCLQTTPPNQNKQNKYNYQILQQEVPIKQQLSYFNRNISLMSQLSYLTQIQTNTNIKVTKQKLLNIIRQNTQNPQNLENKVPFSQVYSEYSVNSNASEAICFLSVLHLCNENNFQLKELSNEQFTIQRMDE